MATSKTVTAGDAVEAVAKAGGPEAARLLTDLMAENSRQNEWVAQALAGSMERERDQWRDRALVAEDRLARIENRILELLR